MPEEIDKISKIIAEISPNNKAPVEEHRIVYDSASEGLEPIYFWVVDKMNEFFGGKVEKVIDSFTSTPGSGHFSELMGKATKFQEEAMKGLGMVNNVVKGIQNLIYDLKNFEIRLGEYDKVKSSKLEESKAGMLALKQVWMDNVDMKRGRGSINQLAYELEFSTLRDAFMIIDSVDKIKDLDLNERVKNILKPRLLEFFEWKEKSEVELRKRYEMERSYLKSQLESLKLYTRWIKPYIVAAAKLEQKEAGRKPEMVTAFNTILLELVLFGKSPVEVNKSVTAGELGKLFQRVRFKRSYNSIVVIDLFFRGIPQSIGGGRYAFGGRTEVVFRAYALNDDEVKMLNQRMGQSDLNDAFKLAEGLTEESLKQLQDDIQKYLSPDEKKKESEKKEESTNPFFALIGIGSKKAEKKEEKKDEKKPEAEITKIEPDNFYELELRKLASAAAQKTCFDLFDIYKKSHGMPSHPSPFG